MLVDIVEKGIFAGAAKTGESRTIFCKQVGKKLQNAFIKSAF
jgi:hypothetical protein